MEECYEQCEQKQNTIGLLKPVTETKSNDTFRLICRDAEAIVIEVQSKVKRITYDSTFNGEVYVVRVVEKKNPTALEAVYVVS